MGGRAVVLVTALLALVALLVPSGAGAHPREEAALDAAREQLNEVARQLESAADDRRQVALAASEARSRVAAIEAAVNQAGAALDRQEMVVAEAGQRMAALQERAAALRSGFAARAASLYKRGSGLPLGALLSARDVQAAVDRGEFLAILTRADQAALEQAMAARVAVRAQRERLELEKQHLAALKRRQEEVLAQASHVLEHRMLDLSEADQEIGQLRRTKENLEEDARQLTRLIQARQRELGGVGPPSASGYVWPVCGRVTSEFGRRWGRLHAGVDIDGATGDPIRAARSGTVIFAGWRGGYGRLTLLDHGGGIVTAYAHQSAISVGVGQEVARGRRIGSVGSTGNSTGSHLHFETRINGHPVNPRQFLPRGC